MIQTKDTLFLGMLLMIRLYHMGKYAF